MTPGSVGVGAGDCVAMATAVAAEVAVRIARTASGVAVGETASFAPHPAAITRKVAAAATPIAPWKVRKLCPPAPEGA